MILAALALPFGAAALANSFPPFDEGPKDKSFAAYRAKLIKVAQAKDLRAFRRYLDRDVRMSFGGHKGIPAAVKMMRSDRRLWGILVRVLKSGGKFERRKVTCPQKPATSTCTELAFVAPYTYWVEPPKGRDTYETMVVLGERVNLRAAPDAKAQVIEKLTHSVVTTPRKPKPKVPRSWVEIEAPSGNRGFVVRRLVRSPIDYRAGFVRTRAGWKMTFFVSGD